MLSVRIQNNSLISVGLENHERRRLAQQRQPDCDLFGLIAKNGTVRVKSMHLSEYSLSDGA
jgi:hypothetical protein